MTAPYPYSVRRLFPFAPTTNALTRTKSGAKGAGQGFSDMLSAFSLPCSASEQKLSVERKQGKGPIKGFPGGTPPLQNGGGWAHKCRFFSPWEWLTTSTTLPLKRGDMEGTTFTKFFLFSSLPTPLGPIAWAKKPSEAGQKLGKRGFSGGAAPSQPPPLRRGKAPPDLPRPCKGPNMATE